MKVLVDLRREFVGDSRLDSLPSIVDKLAQLPGCLGLVLGGSLGRAIHPYIDGQDVDLYAYVRTSDYERYLKQPGFNPDWPWVTDFVLDGMRFSLQFLNYDALERADLSPTIWDPDDHKWTQSNRWDKSLSRIVAEVDGSISGLFHRKVVFPEEESTKIVACLSRELGTEYWGDFRKALARGLVVEAHGTLDRCIDLFVYVLYARERRFCPPWKWRYWWMRVGGGAKAEHWPAVERILVMRGDSVQSVHSRADAFQQLCRELSLPLEAMSRGDEHVIRAPELPLWLAEALGAT